jgi:Tfp pilus assembly PilM family ATPase
MARTVTGIDLGLRSAKWLRGYWKGNTFHVTDFARVELRSTEITDGWASSQPGFKPLATRVGLTGRDVNIRYTRVPRVPDWQLRNLMRFEVEEIGDQSGAGVASDFNLLPQLPEIEGEDVVLLAMARESLLDAHAEGLTRAGGKLEAFTPNAIALYNAYLRYAAVQDETVLLANIGHDNIDVVIVRGPDLLFARNLSGGSRLFEDAIAQRFEINAEKAREIKEKYASLDPQMRAVDPTQEKASRAILGAAGQLLSLLQSTVLFCKSQIKISGLKLDRVLVCGGGAALHGLTKYLANGMNVPVELFDPFRVVDTEPLAPEKKALLDEHKLSSVVALGLATMASDDEAYSIEILPEKERKKREFLGGTVFLIAAGVLAVAYLGVHAWRTRTDLAKARTEAAQLDAQYKKASGVHRKAEELVAENKKLAATARELEGIKGSGEQLARAIGWMQKDLPSEFWVTQLLTDFRPSPELGIQRGEERPVLTVVGRAKEGTNSLTQLYEKFVADVRAKLPPSAALQQQLAVNGSKFTIDVSFFAPERAPKAVVTDEPAEGGR